MSVYATGLTGTIGSFLPGSIKSINIDLASNSQEFEKLKFEKILKLKEKSEKHVFVLYL